MHEKKRKNGMSKMISNASSMMLVVGFLLVCVLIAVVIGIYSVEKSRKETSTEAGQEQPSVNESPENTAQSGEEQASVSHEDESSDVNDVIFESCGAGDVLVDMIHTSGWGEESNPFVQYEVVISNMGDADISDWCVRIKVGADASCFNIWNGTAQMEDDVMVIRPAAFNGTIGSGAQTCVGVIIENPQTPVYERVTFK